MDDLSITDSITIPEGELVWRFDTAGGPGGQHANRSATRVELSFDLGASAAFEPGLAQRMVRSLGSRVRDGVVTVVEGGSRSQWRNRQRARRRLVETLQDAMRVERTRRPTRPGAAARRRRMQDKRRRSETKRLRRRPDPE